VRIEADLVVVDEASMVDLAWMDRLFEACESVPRLVLLGDPDQLASVRAGAVLAELCALAEPGAAVSDERREGSTEGQLARSVVRLRRSHRFAGGGGIGRLAEAIRRGDADEALALLSDPSVAEVSRVSEVSGEQVEEALLEASGGLSAAIEAAADPESKLDRANGYRVLCAHRRGPLGAERLAARLDESLARAHRTTARAGWFAGQLLLVTRNAPDQDLWNGDVGLVGESDRGLRAFFADGRGGVRALSSGRLPAHESAIAMTVHKSQGSEFDRVDLVLGEHDSRLMTRELLYTGVTRARESLRIHASEDLLRSMIGRRIERDSGLAARIRGDDLDSSTPSRGGRA
jgi:exodeoxyribonuclease V alpha subunit